MVHSYRLGIVCYLFQLFHACSVTLLLLPDGLDDISTNGCDRFSLIVTLSLIVDFAIYKTEIYVTRFAFYFLIFIQLKYRQALDKMRHRLGDGDDQRRTR